ARAREEDEKRSAQVKALLEQGRKALADKQYAAAVSAFETARGLAPADAAVLQGLSEARAKADADSAEKAKLAGYKARMEAGRAALEAGRFPDAIREFVAAQQFVPDDAEAAKGLREAEMRLAALEDKGKREAALVSLMERGRAALAEKRYKEAIA